MKKLFVTLAVLALCVSLLAGCGGKTSNTFSGYVSDASMHSLTVEGDGATYTFAMDDNTAFEGRDEGGVALDDGVTVTFTGKLDEAPVAQKVTVTDPAPDPEPEGPSFKGTALEYGADRITVQSADGSATVTFTVDSGTAVYGSPSAGDEVEVVYSGEIGGDPVAASISVLSEHSDPGSYTASGTAVDVSSASVTVSVSSAHSYVFIISNATKISGKATKVSAGDEVRVTYTGALSGSPAATAIEVVKTGGAVASKVSGVVASTASNGFSVNTGSHTYFFATNSSTKYTGTSLAANCKVTVTYTGELSGSPTATEVYCTAAPTPAPTPVPTPTPEPAPTPVENPMRSGRGTVEDYYYTGIEIYTDGGAYVTLGIMDGTEIYSGVEEGDYVSYSYNSASMQAAYIRFIYSTDAGEEASGSEE